jgi:hypothetical protein
LITGGVTAPRRCGRKGDKIRERQGAVQPAAMHRADLASILVLWGVCAGGTMKKSIGFVIVVVAALELTVSTAFVAPSCSKWMPQPDGSLWRLCVGHDGRQYCESAKGNLITRVKCN